MLKIHLHTIRAPKEKVHILCERAAFHFLHKEPFFILCPDERSCRFVDEVLWSFQKSSFLPHEDILKEPQEMITFGVSLEPFSGKVVFNLKNEVLPEFSRFSTIYDFEDLSSPEKEKASLLRYKAYKNLGSVIICYAIS